MYLQTSDAIWLYTLQYPIISFYKFWWSLSFPRAVSTLTFCASFAPPVRKCNNMRPVELPDFWPSNSLGLNTFHYKIWGSESTTKSAGFKWFEVASVWCVSWSVTEHYWRWHWSRDGKYRDIFENIENIWYFWYISDIYQYFDISNIYPMHVSCSDIFRNLSFYVM